MAVISTSEQELEGLLCLCQALSFNATHLSKEPWSYSMHTNGPDGMLVELRYAREKEQNKTINHWSKAWHQTRCIVIGYTVVERIFLQWRHFCTVL